MASAGRDKAFEIFVKRAITSIHKEAWGRTKDSKDIKDSCQNFLTILEQHETGVSVFEGSLAHAVLQPLLLACSSSNVKIVELALGALHKLVAHAWLQGESSTAEELMPDDTDTVTRVIKRVIKCGEISNANVQLSVIRALLTFSTAEHFVAHGDSLMSAVRAVFNLALGSESEDIKRTACNALLQMLNTIAKRVTAYYLFCSTPLPRRDSEPEQQNPSRDHSHTQSALPNPHFPSQLAHQLSTVAWANQHHSVSASRPGSQINSMDGTTTTAADTQEAAGAPDARTAQLAQLAEQHDIRGLEAALGASAVDDMAHGGLPRSTSNLRPTTSTDLQERHSVNSTASSLSGTTAQLTAARPTTLTLPDTVSIKSDVLPGSKATASEPPVQLTVLERDVLLVLTAFCKLASREAGLTEVESYLHQGKLLALELLVKVLQNPQHRWENTRDAFMRALRQPVCITLLRNCAASDAAAFQLAIKLLMSVMMQPKLRSGLKAELGAFYPLFVLVPLEQGCNQRASDAGQAGADGAATGDAAGAGAAGGPQTDLHTLYIVLTTLKQLCGDPQLVVDLFVNYDCDPQAPPLYERTIKVLGRIAQRTELTDKDRLAAAPNQPAAKQQQEATARLAAVRDAAFKCITALLQSVNQWAGPLREQHQAHVHSEAGNGTTFGGDAGDANSSVVDGHSDSSRGGAGEAERLEAVWAHKSTLAKGIALFNTSPVKGIRYLAAQNLVEQNPQAVATFVREHAKDIDKVALGEYFGRHEAFPVAVMHAFIDHQEFSGVSIDDALRVLLKQFRLPGEAQKIDRIMEKFAERYFVGNPGIFRNADGAYLLSFAIIMLNTDAHNPLAERRLGKPDFVNMCHQTLSEEEGGGMAPVMEPSQLEAIYDRIVTTEIQVLDADAAATKQQAAAAAAERARNLSVRTRLASALGLYMLAAPFRPLTRSWGKAAQGLPESERRKQLVKLAERAIVRGAGSAWVAAIHTELCRPVLTVSAGPVVEALASGINLASTPTAAEPLLQALLVLAQLAALLRLDEVCERSVEVLAAACGVATPAAHGTAQEAKQLAALKALVSLASMPDVGSLGSAWAVLLRTVSQLDALTDDLLQTDAMPQPQVQTPMDASGASPFNKMFQAWGISLGGVLPPQSRSSTPDSTAVGTGGFVSAGGSGPAVRSAAGAAMVVWALSEGKTMLEQVFGLSSGLDGEAVVVYFRALCAVGREELDLTTPRLSFLRRLVQCARENTDRIRFIWSRLWAIISQHLVAAACHPMQQVALFAVEALRDLAVRLITRAELTNFRVQEEALLPFVSVLRQCDDARVREVTVSHLDTVVRSPHHGLGGGWRTLLEALHRATSDSSTPVVSGAVKVLELPIAALLSGPAPAGHSCLQECARAAASAAQNPAAATPTSVTAVRLLAACASQLGAYCSKQHGSSVISRAASTAAAGTNISLQHEGPASSLSTTASTDVHSRDVEGWSLLLAHLADIACGQERRPAVASAAAQAILELIQQHNQHWSNAGWQSLLTKALPAMFHVPLATSTHANNHEQQSRAASAITSPSPEFLSRVEHFFPLVCEQLANTPASHYTALLSTLADIALFWLQQAHEALIKCGLSGYEQLLGLMVARQDMSSVQLLLSMLQPVLQAQLSTVMVATQHVQQAQLQQHSHQQGELLQVLHQQQAWQQLDSTQGLGAASHMLLLAYRVLARVHTTHQHAMPWEVQVQVLNPLLHGTRQCMAFNQHLQSQVLHPEEQQAAATKQVPVMNGKLHANKLGHDRLPLHHSTTSAKSVVPIMPEPALTLQPAVAAPATAATAQGQTGKSPSQTPRHSASGTPSYANGGASKTGMQDADEDEADSILEAQTKATPVAPSSRQLSPAKAAMDSNARMATASNTVATAAAVGAGHSRPQQKVAHPYGSFSNGVLAAGQVLAPPGSAAATADAVSTLQTSLVRLELESAGHAVDCLEAICCGGGSKQASSDAGDAEQLLRTLCVDIVRNGAAMLTQMLQTGLGQQDATVLDGASHAAGLSQHHTTHVYSTWLEGMRAPLLARAVLVSASMPGAADVHNVRLLFPHLLVVMCSHHAMVREAVAVCFSQTIRPLVMGPKPAA